MLLDYNEYPISKLVHEIKLVEKKMGFVVWVGMHQPLCHVGTPWRRGLGTVGVGHMHQWRWGQAEKQTIKVESTCGWLVAGGSRPTRPLLAHQHKSRSFRWTHYPIREDEPHLALPHSPSFPRVTNMWCSSILIWTPSHVAPSHWLQEFPPALSQSASYGGDIDSTRFHISSS